MTYSNELFSNMNCNSKLLMAFSSEGCSLVSPGSSLPPTNPHNNSRALLAGHWHIINLSISQIRTATISITIFSLSHRQFISLFQELSRNRTVQFPCYVHWSGTIMIDIVSDAKKSIYFCTTKSTILFKFTNK